MAGNSLAKKLALAVFTATAVLLSIMALFSANYAQNAMEAKGKEELKEQIRSAKSMVTSYEASVKSATNRLFNFFAVSFDQPVSLDTRDSVVSGDKSLPVLKLAGNPLNNQTGLVDRFNTIAGMPATVFVLHDGTFYRIATSVKKENGERAVGTSLPKEHPAVAKLLAGEEYIGKAVVVGKTMMTKYKALKDGSGKVVGAIFIGLDFEAGMQDLKKQILATKIGTSGYLFVLDSSNTDSKGKLIVHPKKEGENVLTMKDTSGREFNREMIERKTGEIVYPWKAEGDSSARDKIAVFDTFGEWNWLIAGGTYLDEFSEDGRTLRNVLIAGSIITILILGAIVVLLANRMVKEPLQAMVSLFGQISQGNLNNTIAITSDDEIGELQRAVQHMQSSLSTLVREIKEVVNSAQQGDFSRQVSLAGKQGFGLEVGESLNALVTTADTGLTDIMQIAQALAEGDLSKTISKTYPGTFGTTVNSINTTVRVLNQVISEVREIVNNASEGNFSQRLEAGQKKGYAKTLANLLNRLSDNAASALGDISRVAQSLGKGDLTQTVEKDYPGLFGETARGINATTKNLQDLIGSVVLAVGTIDVAAQEISAGNKDLSARTQEQATSLEETAASLEQFSSMMEHNTDSAKEASQLANIASDVAVKGGAVVKASVTTMTQISESSKRIGDIIGVIDGIAFQTNILALNAAVEAARAGEQGRGFAVVASEVRSLAQRSAQAAKEIKDLITDSVEKVERGTEQAEEAGQTMDNIVTAIGKVTEIITNISRASLEQSSGIAQINQALVQMDGVTQQNASLVEESAAAAESLESQARDLQGQISSFRLHR